MRSVFILLFLSTIVSYGQSGYLINHRGDTVRGEFKIFSYDRIDHVQAGTGRKKQAFTALQVRRLFMKEENFEPVAFDNSIRMMKVVTKGYLSMYKFRYPNQTTYDGLMLKKLTGESRELPNLFFKRIMSDFLADCVTLAAAISEKEVSRTDIESIVVQYNDCMDKKTPPPKHPAASEIEKLTAKVEASSLEAKKDILDLLTDLKSKVSKGEPVPKYLSDGLKNYLSDKAEFAADLQLVLDLMSK